MNANRRPMTPQEYRVAQARAMTEAHLLDAVLGTPRRPGLALALGWRGYHTHRSEHSPAGFPDLVLVKAGRLIFAELKRQNGKTTADQDAWLDDLDAVHWNAGNYEVDPPYEPVTVHLWRPMDYLDGTIGAVLRGGDTPPLGLALPPRT